MCAIYLLLWKKEKEKDNINSKILMENNSYSQSATYYSTIFSHKQENKLFLLSKSFMQNRRAGIQICLYIYLKMQFTILPADLLI